MHSGPGFEHDARGEGGRSILERHELEFAYLIELQWVLSSEYGTAEGVREGMRKRMRGWSTEAEEVGKGTLPDMRLPYES